jgi:hypothetical protein
MPIIVRVPFGIPSAGFEQLTSDTSGVTDRPGQRPMTAFNLTPECRTTYFAFKLVFAKQTEAGTPIAIIA